MIDVTDARQRRRFYLERASRKRPFGAGSDLWFLMDLPRSRLLFEPERVFAGLPYLVVGGVATRAYAPERFTKDIDFLLDHERYSEGNHRLEAAGFEKRTELVFPNTSLGLYGSAWSRESIEIDVMSSAAVWCREAFEGRSVDQTGLRVIPLAYLVLMKFESARGIDQGDLTRMLGIVPELEVAAIAAIVARHSGDPAAAEEIRQYAEIGRWERAGAGDGASR